MENVIYIVSAKKSQENTQTIFHLVAFARYLAE